MTYLVHLAQYGEQNENIQEQLQLPVIERWKGQLANSHIVEYDVRQEMVVNPDHPYFAQMKLK